MDERYLIENEDKKNKFYLIAIKNLIRKNNLSELIAYYFFIFFFETKIIFGTSQLYES